MASNNSKSKSILRSSSESTTKASRRGVVSFATNIQQTQNIHTTNTAASDDVSRMMNDVEEDAFDPSSLQDDTDDDTSMLMLVDTADTTADTSSSLSLKQIRDLKSKRALQRVAAGAVDGFDGEEEVDERYSLLQQDGGDGDDNDDEQGEGHGHGPGSLDLNDNSEKQKQEACPIEPFNMTSEREDGSGYFDGDTYVFRRGNPEEEEDAWLDNLDQNNGNGNGNEYTSKDSSSTSNINAILLQKGNGNNSKTNTQSSITTTITSNANANDNAARDAHTRAMNEMTKEQIYDELVPLLATDSESIIQALGRYGSIIKRETKQLKLALLRKKQAKDSTQTQTQTRAQNVNIKKAPSASAKALNRLTELSNVCMMKYDDSAIYDRDRAYFTNLLGKSDAEEAMKRKRSYFTGADADVNADMDGIGHGMATKRSRGDAGAGADDAAANTKAIEGSISVHVNAQWEYRGNEDNAIHGPYKTQEMMEWIKAGYFVGPMAVDVRMITRDADTNGHNGGKDEPESKSKEEVVDDLLGDLEDSDDESEGEAKGRETGIDSSIASEWQRSDEIDFSKYQ
mmetsp:Transcript_17394/g.25996  ORF Transcript_17394/g.25996 Transcript_17394/m.25996 type:complete len:569 (-) Transcript_17394:175-1881(-)